MKVKKLIQRTAVILIAGYMVILIVLFFAQRSLVFAPDPQRVQLAEAPLPTIREVVLENEQAEKLICWHGLAEQGQPTLLYFHGNGGNVAGRGQCFRQLMAKGFGVFMVGYPGYGGSDGSPSESSFIEAAKIAYDHLKATGIDANEIVICGQSLGTCVATQLAAREESRALVLVAPLKSVLEMASQQYPHLPIRWLLRDPFQSDQHIKQVVEPLLIVHGGADQVIPIETGRSLFELGNQPKHFETITGGGHNDLYDFPIVDRIESFLDSVSADDTNQSIGTGESLVDPTSKQPLR